MQAVTSGTNAINVIKATLDPRGSVTAPPMLDAQSAFTKTVDLSGNFTINDTALVAEKVPTSTGVILDFVARGVASTYRFGIVPAGAQSPTNTIPLVQGATPTSGVVISYPYSMPIPYFDDGVNQIKVGPDLTQNFSMTRKYSGALSVLCDTVPIGNTALNGYLTASSIADTRDVAQVLGASPSCFDSTNLVQCSVSAKDGVKEVNVMRGVCTLVGPDIPPTFSVPSSDSLVHLDGGASVITTGYMDKNSNLPTATDISWPLYNCFLSPWGITMSGLTGVFPNTLFENFTIPPINVCGEVNYRVSLENWQTRAGQPNGTFIMYVQSTDYFGTCSANGAVVYHTRSIMRACPLIQNVEIGNIGIMAPLVFDLDGANQGDVNIATRGVYLGSYIRIFYSFPKAAAWNANPLNIGRIRIHSMPTSIYACGELGPVRVVKWDGLANGQVIRVDGRYNVQCVAQGSIAPFTQNASMYSDTGVNMNVFPLLHELYNGPGLMRRVWVLDEYRAMLTKLQTITSPEELAQAHEKLVNAANAAGVFESLGGALGGLFGNAGSSIGRSIGSLGDMGYQAANKFLGNAAGMYGQSAGMYGQSAGMYGQSAGMYGMAAGMFPDAGMGNKRLRIDQAMID